MDLHHYFIFVSIAFFYIISPGPAVFLAINYGAFHGIKKTAMVMLGNSTGLAILASVSAFGLGAIIVQSFFLLSLVKVLGAMVLFYLGCKMLWSALKPKARSTSFNETQRQDNIVTEQNSALSKSEITANNYASFYKKGLFLSLSNPKAIIFFTAIFPQFMTAGESIQSNLSTMLFLGATFAVMSFFCMNTYNILGQKVLARFLTNIGIKIMNLFSGALFIGMSGMLAFSDLGQQSK